MKKSTAWIMFAISSIVCIILLIVAPQWFWVTLPFISLGIVEGLGVI